MRWRIEHLVSFAEGIERREVLFSFSAGSHTSLVLPPSTTIGSGFR